MILTSTLRKLTSIMNVRKSFLRKKKIYYTKLTFTDLENHDYIELNWKCPGRKSLQKAEDKEPQIYQTPPKESSVHLRNYFDDTSILIIENF